MPKRPLAPRFITKLDDYLLKNRPDTWTTRVHLVVYYTLVYALGLSILCFVIPDNPLRDSFTGYWVTSQSVLVICAIILWVVYLVRFNTFKSYGITYGGDRLKTYFSFFIAIILMIGTVFIPLVVETYKTMIHFSPSQLTEDMDKMNILLARLSKDEFPAEITVDTIYVVSGTSGAYNYNPSNGSYTWNDSLGAYVKGPVYMTREELKWTISDQDSVVWITNDKLIRFQVTSLQFLSDYRNDDEGDRKALTSFQIYNRVYKSGVANDVQALEREFYEISQKYRDPHNDDPYWNYNTDAYSIISSKYNVGQVNQGISNIFSRYYRWEKEEIIISYHVIYYIGMFLGLCLFIFRHSTIRTFFLSVLTGIILAIITGIIGAFFDWQEEGFLAIAFVYFAFFFVFAITTVNWKIRSVFTGIALNLAVVCTPFLPFLAVVWYYAGNDFYYDYYAYGYSDDSYQDFVDTRNLHYWLSELFGFLILIVLIETVYKWMYRKWFAAPEE